MKKEQFSDERREGSGASCKCTKSESKKMKEDGKERNANGFICNHQVLSIQFSVIKIADGKGFVVKI